MRFVGPTGDLMTIKPRGHWSLGPTKTGPLARPCIELCLGWMAQRAAGVVCAFMAPKRLESVVVVVEARPGVADSRSGAAPCELCWWG